mgnify:CR=1 FL=1
MKKLSKYEKETIINWNEAENLASVYTFNASFAGAEVQRAASPLWRGAGAAAHCWGQGATPIGRLRAAAIIGSRTKCLGRLRAAAPSGQG